MPEHFSIFTYDTENGWAVACHCGWASKQHDAPDEAADQYGTHRAHMILVKYGHVEPYAPLLAPSDEGATGEVGE